MNNRVRFTCLVLLLLACVSAAAEFPPWQKPSAWPDRIIATLSAGPATGFSVSWRTEEAVQTAVAEIVKARAGARFDVGAQTVTAQTERFEFDPKWAEKKPSFDASSPLIDPVSYHSVEFTGLQPDTLYAYRVRGAEDNWSAWQQIRTAPLDGPVEFIYFGDSQNGIRSHVSRVFEAAALVSPEARFLVHCGDLVNTSINDQGWAEWFEAGGALLRRVPSAPAAGNHDYFGLGPKDSPDRFNEAALAPFWKPQFRLPVVESLPEGLHESVYDVRYTKDLHLFVLDSTGPHFDLQLEWLEQQFSASDARWRIVYMHHPYFSWVGDGKEPPYQTVRRAQFDAFLAGHDVDLVLTGHRHSYQRAESGPQVHQVDKEKRYEVDTVFLVTAMTIKRGVTKVDGWERFSQERDGNFTLTRWGDYVPIFGVIRIDGDELVYRGLDAVGETYDAFTLTKDAAGRKTIINGQEAFGPVWTTETAGPYRDWRE